MIVPQPPADSLRRVLGEVLAGPAYQWRDESSGTVAARRYWRQLMEWLSRLEGDHPTLFQGLVWALILLFGAVALHAIWVVIRTTRRAPVSDGAVAAGSVPVSKDAPWYAAEALRLAQAGRFAAAMQADFVRLTLELDRQRVLRFHLSKTPREYLADLRLPDTPRRDFASLVTDLYRFAFAGEPCDVRTFESFRARVDSLRYAPQP